MPKDQEPITVGAFIKALQQLPDHLLVMHRKDGGRVVPVSWPALIHSPTSGEIFCCIDDRSFREADYVGPFDSLEEGVEWMMRKYPSTHDCE